MRIVFGIGNPGIRYEYTRHNAGFLLLDYFALKNSIRFKESSGEYLEAKGTVAEHDYYLTKPVTYVNNSGIAAKQIFENYNIVPEDFLVVCDDSNLEKLDLRIRLFGGDGGHNGLHSIIYHLNTDKFPRIRIGIGRSAEEENLAGYVLSEFSESDLKDYENTFKVGSQLIKDFIIGGCKKMLETNSIINSKNLNGFRSNNDEI